MVPSCITSGILGSGVHAWAQLTFRRSEITSVMCNRRQGNLFYHRMAFQQRDAVIQVKHRLSCSFQQQNCFPKKKKLIRMWFCPSRVFAVVVFFFYSSNAHEINLPQPSCRTGLQRLAAFVQTCHNKYALLLAQYKCAVLSQGRL